MCSGKGNKNSLCDCHCGTRVDVNPQLLEERELWKAKYEQLDLQRQEDIKNLTDKMYKDFSVLLEQELQAKEHAFRDEQKRRITEYQTLHDRMIPMEPRLNELHMDNQFLRSQVKTLNDDIKEAEDRLNRERKHNASDLKELIDRHNNEMEEFETQKDEEFDRERKETQAQIYHLRHQIADFEAKYRQILPQLEKLRHTLHSKTSEAEDLRVRLGEEVSRSRNDPLGDTTNRRTAPQRRSDQTLEFEFRALQREMEEKNRQIEKLKSGKEHIKTEIKFQTVYVDRPVQVEKIVEKIVEVQRVIKEYVQPRQPVVVNEIICDDDREDYDDLVTEINNRTRYISELHNKIADMVRQSEEYQSASEEYQRNIEKYKSERQNLAQTIGNKNREIEALEAKLHGYMSQHASSSNNEKIIVNVKKDGTYTSTVEKVSKQPARKK